MLLFIFFVFLFGCQQPASHHNAETGTLSSAETKDLLLSLERKWLDAEFALDTAYISSLMDSSFIDISADHISNKQQALNGMYENIWAMHKDSIFLDSLKFEDPIVNLYGNTAVITLVTHSYKKHKSSFIEKRMRFYDVWTNMNGSWKAVSSQGTVIK